MKLYLSIICALLVSGNTLYAQTDKRDTCSNETHAIPQKEPKFLCILVAKYVVIDINTISIHSGMPDPIYIKDGRRVFYNPLSDYDRNISPY